MRPSRRPHPGHRAGARALFFALALCVACRGSGVRGEYRSTDGVVLNFKSNGKVEMTMPKMFGVQQPTQEWDYALEDRKIMLGLPGMPRMVMPIDENGCFVLDLGLAGGKMCKTGSAGTKTST